MRVAIIVSVVVHALAILLAAQDALDPPPLPIVAVVEEPKLEWVGVVMLPDDAKLTAIDPATLLEPSRPQIAALEQPPADTRPNERPPADTRPNGQPNERSTPGDRDVPGERATQRNERSIARSTTGTVERPTAERTPERPNPLAMRRKEPATFALSEKFIEQMLNKPPGEIPDVPGARIDHRIAELMDKRRHPPPGYNYTDDLQELVALREEKKQLELKKQKDGSYESEKTTYVAKVAQDGTVKLVDKPNIQREGLGARFDVTDAVMRAFGADPYASDKLKFLDRTRDQRVAIGNEHRKATLERSRWYATDNVTRAWAAAPDLAAKKRVLFELWDECAETGREDMIQGGADARAFIVNFIQWKLVGKEAYTADELRALNAKRTSKAVFSPYE